jgi:tetratricopeptide (TPR) repeat protein
MLKELFLNRSIGAAVLVLLAVSLVLTQVPLFNYLGYEFAASIATVWSLVAGLLTISLWNRDGQDQRPETRSFLGRAATLGLAPLLLPVVIISLNAFFIKNCSFLGGAVLFLLVALPAVLLAQAFAFFVCAWVRRWRRTVFFIGWLMALGHILAVTFTGPQIFAFTPILGYFPGLTYDESLEVADRLFLYRLGTLACTYLFVLAAGYLHRHRHPEAGQHMVPASGQRRAIAVTMISAIALMFFFSNDLGLSSSESHIEKTLGGSVETEHFVITYPDSVLTGERLAQVVELHEFIYYEITRELRTRPARKIRTFLYQSAEQKGRLIGAAGTNIAKPWLWQLHINLADIDASLKHELVHVFAADFGFPLIRIGINSGLIEGLAVAVERVEYEEHIHRLAALAVQQGLAPDIQSLFSLTGFMKAPAGASYVVAGSFCRYLIDWYGMRRFKLLYRTGEFAILYGKPLPTLIEEWKRFLATFRFKDGDRSKAEYLFKRHSIFGKECARVIANLNSGTRHLLSQRKYEEALLSAERSLAQSVSVEASVQKATALVRLGRNNEAIAFAESQLADSTTASSFLTLRVLLGDALWGSDSLERALKIHAGLLRSHISLPWDEALSLRLEILLRPDLSGSLRPYYLSLNDDSSRVALLESLHRHNPAEPVTRVLLAREKASKELYEEALGLLDGISSMPSPILELARQRRLGVLSLALGHYEQAKIYFWQSLNHVYRDSQTAELQELLQFCEWMSLRKPGID